MSDYGPPASAPTDVAATAAGSARLVELTNYAAAGLGVLAFICGFLDWLSVEGEGGSGFGTVGGAGIGLALVAGLLALAAVFEKTAVTLTPAAFAVAGLLVVFGSLVSHPSEESVSVGLILALITALVQVAALGYGWMLGTGRIAAPAPRPAKPQALPPAQWQQSPPPGYGAPQGGYQQGPPAGYPQGPPAGYPQGPPSGYAQGPPAGYPQGPPAGYPQGPPSGYDAPASPPTTAYGQPPSQPQRYPEPESDANATQVFNRPPLTPTPPEPADDAPGHPAPEPQVEAPRDWSRPSDSYGQ